MTPRYCKIADSVVDAELGPYAGWLYTVIVRHINRKCNELCKTVKELAVLAGMSARSVIRYTKVLEAKSLLKVQRSQTGEVADVNIYSLSGESAQVSLFNGVTVSQSASGSQSHASAEGHVPQSHCNESDSNDSLNVRERDFHPEGIDQTKFFQDDPPDSVPPYLREQMPSVEIRQQLAAHGQRLGLKTYAEVINRCANARSWEYVLKALANEQAPSPVAPPPPPAEAPTEPDWMPEIVEPKIPAADEPAKNDDPNVETWAVVMGQLEAQLDTQIFHCLKGTTYLREEDGQWVCQASTLFARDLLQHRLYREIRRVVRDVRGEVTELRFETAGAVTS